MMVSETSRTRVLAFDEMTTKKLCMQTWIGKDGKEHYCTLDKGHQSLTCFCSECNAGKWFGKKLALARAPGARTLNP